MFRLKDHITSSFLKAVFHKGAFHNALSHLYIKQESTCLYIRKQLTAVQLTIDKVLFKCVG